jgi:hypothetical protein
MPRVALVESEIAEIADATEGSEVYIAAASR